MTTTASDAGPEALRPITLGPREVRNRVAFVATVNHLGSHRRITPEQVAFYAERAAGGVGLVITEGLSVHPTSIPNGTIPLAYEPDLVPGFATLAEAVHTEGGLVLGQLWHVGRQALWHPNLIPWGPSHERDPYSGTTPHRMSVAEIHEVIEGFVRSARHLRDAGFDGVEVHGAHGYLLTQFLSPWSNQRDDGWGGDLDGRVRLLLEVVQGIRTACGPDFLVGVKLTVDEYVDGGLDIEATQQAVERLVDTVPVDYLAASQAGFGPDLDRHVPDLAYPDAPFVRHAAAVRESSAGVPVMALSKVPDIATASALIRDGYAELVGMSRPLLADAHLVDKTARGEAPRPCVFCNDCWGLIHAGRPIGCFYAPRTGRELELPPVQRSTSTPSAPVHVVGAGPAGLELARVALLRGFEVHVYERASACGGRLAVDAAVAGRERMGDAVRWLEDQVTALGGHIHTGTVVDEALVSTWPADALCVWTAGAEPDPPSFDGGPPVIPLEEAIGRIADLAGQRVLLIDEIQNEPVYAFAAALAGDADVQLSTRHEHLGRHLAYVSRMGALRRMDEAGVGVHCLTAVDVAGGVVRARHVFSRREHNIDQPDVIVAAGPYVPIPPVGNGPWVVAGDAIAPRGLATVVREAHEAARSLDRASGGGAR